jgi:hypothetical protein
MDGDVHQFHSIIFKRGQVAAALWFAHTGGLPRLGALPAPPKAFLHRIARFIELGVPFESNERPGKPGADLGFTLEHVLELGIALDLQNAGLNQLEIARALIFYRGLVRDGITIDLMPNLGSKAKPPIFLTFGKLPAPTIFDGFSPALTAGVTIGEPVFLVGADAVRDEMQKLRSRDRVRIIVEIDDLARLIFAGLLRAPARRRGQR